MKRTLSQDATHPKNEVTGDGVETAATTAGSSTGPVKAIVMDIEGTTTSISFVHDVLFPYARNNLDKHLNDHWGKDELEGDIEAIRKQAAEDLANHIEGTELIPDSDAPKEEIIAKVKTWVHLQMDKDRKIGALKTLQGHIWEEAYKSGAVKGHLYKDAYEAIRRWKTEYKIPLYIYSSGSVPAQKLLFGYSEFGNILEFFSGHFDTTIGMKVDAISYHRIADEIFPRDDGEQSGEGNPNPEAHAILFLTDNIKEAEAAKTANFRTVLSVREGTAPLPEKHAFHVVTSFDAVDAPFGLKKLE